MLDTLWRWILNFGTHFLGGKKQHHQRMFVHLKLLQFILENLALGESFSSTCFDSLPPTRHSPRRRRRHSTLRLGMGKCLAPRPASPPRRWGKKLFFPFSLASPPLFSTFHDILPPYREKSLGKKGRKGPPEELESLSTYPSRYFCSFFVVK